MEEGDPGNEVVKTSSSGNEVVKTSSSGNESTLIDGHLQCRVLMRVVRKDKEKREQLGSLERE